jgi:hypothetical protein
MNENLVNLDRLLQFHDWNYMYSDDHSVWRLGQGQRAAIDFEQRRVITEGLATTEEVIELTNKYRPKN